MKAGDQVRVYPHGSPDMAAIATVILLSANGYSIALGFEDSPPFAINKRGIFIDPERGVIVMLAMRGELNGKAWGPWIEQFNQGHYEIEEVTPS